MHFIGIGAPTAIDVLLYLDYPFQFVIVDLKASAIRFRQTSSAHDSKFKILK